MQDAVLVSVSVSVCWYACNGTWWSGDALKLIEMGDVLKTVAALNV